MACQQTMFSTEGEKKQDQDIDVLMIQHKANWPASLGSAQLREKAVVLRAKCDVAVRQEYGEGVLRCRCPECHSDDVEDLQLDHVHGDGKKDREARKAAAGATSVGSGMSLSRKVAAEGANYGKDVNAGEPIKLQLLCSACNRSKGRGFTCGIHGDAWCGPGASADDYAVMMGDEAKRAAEVRNVFPAGGADAGSWS